MPLNKETKPNLVLLVLSIIIVSYPSLYGFYFALSAGAAEYTDSFSAEG